MIKKKRLALMITVFLAALMLASVSFTYAEGGDSASEDPLREVHKVAVGGKTYCFFVTKNVVITPEEISAMSDNEVLEAWILDCAGLYMKEANCKDESHKAITAEDWTKTGGRFLLSDDDITSIREAVPNDGEPFKLYMDLKVSDKPAPADPDAGDQSDVYSTYKKVSPKLLFVAVATEADAATPEDICEAPARKPEEMNNQKKIKMPKMPKVSDGGDMLPEYRSIRMADRSGKPVEETLQDGTPVTLEWIEPSKHFSDDKTFIDHIPGRYAGLAVILGALAAILILIIRRRKKDED